MGTPSLHARSAMFVLGRLMYIVGGDAGSVAGHTDHAAALDMNVCTAPSVCVGLAKRAWIGGEVLGESWAAAGHTAENGVLLGGLSRLDTLSPIAFILPDFKLESTASQNQA